MAFATTEAFAGHALSFDGTDDSVVVPHDPQLNLVSGDFAIESWVYLNASGSQTIASKGDGNGIATNDAWIFQIQGDKIALQLVDGVSTSEWGLSTTNVPLNEWVHVAVSFTGTTASFYLNGVADGTHNYGFSPSDNGDSQSMYMARQGSVCDCNYLNGDLDELKIWSAVKSDFSDRYSLVDLSIPQPNLVAYYSFDEGVGATNILDASVNTNDGTVNGATFNTSTVPLGPPLSVTTTTPIQLESNILASDNILIDFDATLDGTSLNATNIKVWGSQSGLATAIYSGGGSSTLTINPDADFLAGEKVSVIITNGVRGLAGEVAV
ncbi:MAG: LamG-like jellyroll fold domain-containing protein, partial [Pseudomonadales bacterium]